MADGEGLSDSHLRHVGAMGPFRYVILELRIHLFSSTDAPNPGGSHPTIAT